MLMRAARSKPHRDTLRRIAELPEPLFLPWLCPAQLRFQSQARRFAPRVRKPAHVEPHAEKRSALLPSKASRRNLATAAAEHQAPYEEYIPFEGSTSIYNQPRNSHREWYESKSLGDLKPFDPSLPLILNNSLDREPRPMRAHNGIGSNITEIFMTLEACLKVGRLERAGALVKRLMRVSTPGSKDVLDAHNQYLRSCVTQIVRNRDEPALKAAQRWFEVEMRDRGVSPDATTYALLIKATLQALHGPKSERTVRRYIDLAARSDHDLEVLNLPILSDSELFQVTRICPTRYYQADEVVEEPPTTETRERPTSSPGASRYSELVPEVRPVEQKGLGLKALKKSLSIFSKASALPYPSDLQGTQEENDRVFAQMRQHRLEEDAVDSAIQRWQEESENLRKIGMNSALQTNSISALMWEWHGVLTGLVQEEIQLVDEAEVNISKVGGRADPERCMYGPYLRLLPPDKLSAVTIIAAMTLFGVARSSTEGIKLATAVVHLGAGIQDEALVQSLAKHHEDDVWGNISPKDRQQKLANLTKRGHLSDSLTKLVSGKERKPLGTRDGVDRQWPALVKAKVGASMVSLLIKAARMQVTRENPETGKTVAQSQPAFYHTYQYKKGKKLGILMANSALVEMLKTKPVRGALTKHLPMVAEPKKWSDFQEGGFLRFPVKVMRVKNGAHEQRLYAQAASEKGDMDQVYAGLDVLAKTSWIINREVFEVMLEAWNTGQAIAKIPPERPEIVYPPEPASSADSMTRARWLRAVKRLENAKGGLHSQRCFQNFQLEVARAFLNEKFYFPHNIDFRGRAYPVPPYFNHMGADNCRGLLMFGEGKELGPAGLRWLKVHLANVFGYDKASLQQREDFAAEHLQDIFDSATRPLNGGRWWLDAEDPWQCLAACIELKSALDSPDPIKFISHLPIHQDGTCNGLQHYAALGGDVWGAKQVNLEPGDKPADIYTAVAELVKGNIADDAAKGNEVAKALDGKITRKVVKQTVMTNVYGVTWSGARMQVRKQLVELFPNMKDSPTINYGTMAALVAKRIFDALSNMFRGAHDIQYWLGECSNRISQSLTVEQLDRLEREAKDKHISSTKSSKPSKSKLKLKADSIRANFMSSVVWTTPLMMPVVQPYRDFSSTEITTTLQKVTIANPSRADPVSKRKQLQGFPPNFIHSLDATHMLLSALNCSEAGLTFAAVHDSFWTHAADVPTMNKILRSSFVRMHSEDIIKRLASEFENRYKGNMYLASVLASSPVGKRISSLRKSSNYKGGSNSLEEILIERKRLRLLESDDPALQEEGKGMTTPASIFAEAASEEDLTQAEELVDTGIGDIPKRQTKLQADKTLEVGDEDNIELQEIVPDHGDVLKNLAGINSDAFDVDDDDGGIVKQEPNRRKRTRKVIIWLPLTFPPVPKKGDFDISRLEDSQYFFS